MSLPPAGLPGLPPLPKSLSAAIEAKAADNVNQKHNTSNCSPLELLEEGAKQALRSNNNHTASTRHGSISSTQESISDRDSAASRASSSLSAGETPSSTETLDAQIALLRQEMFSLRQLDLSLLSQLWALNESIQDFRTILQETEELSPSPTPSNTGSISSDEGAGDGAFSPMAQVLSMPVAAAAGGSCSSASASQGSSSTSASTSLSAAVSAAAGNYAFPPMQQQAKKSSKQANSANSRLLAEQQAGRVAYANNVRHSELAAGYAMPQQLMQHAGNSNNSGRSHTQQSISRTHSQQSASGRPQSQQNVHLDGRSYTQEHGAVGGRVHPQLPPILQQRMRRPPPPPPPPARGKSPNQRPV